MTTLMHCLPAQCDAGDGPAPANAIVTWDSSEPWLFQFEFYQKGHTAHWTVGRDLLAGSLLNPGEHGKGDIILEAKGTQVLMFLKGDPAPATIRMPRGSLTWIVQRSYDEVPDDTEAMVAAVSALLEEAEGWTL